MSNYVHSAVSPSVLRLDKTETFQISCRELIILHNEAVRTSRTSIHRHKLGPRSREGPQQEGPVIFEEISKKKCFF